MTTIRPITDSDRLAWSDLYAAYADFYRTAQTQQMRDTVWSWLMDEHHGVNGLIAIDASGNTVGLAHYRPFARPLAASTGGYLDDLFVAPSARGQEIGRQLIAALVDVAKQKQWTVLRWITAEDNYRARGAYDRIATRTPWITYDIPV